MAKQRQSKKPPEKKTKAHEIAAHRTVRVGVDTGGTFTDFVAQAGAGNAALSQTRVLKLASTPDDPSRAIIAGLQVIAREANVALRDIEIVHGTTVGTNALLERRGARTAFVTTAGFEDTLHIGRQTRPALYDLSVTRPRALVPRELSFGVRERTGASGEIIEELSDAEIEKLIEELKRARIDSVAVSLLFSFANPKHERRIERALRKLNIPLSISHRILPEYREYERGSTVAANAYLQPLMKKYTGALSERAPRLRVMQSSGGSVEAAGAGDEPVRTILSGPAGGVVGARAAAREAGIADIITFDMGGTSTDAALCAEGRVHLTNESIVSGVPVAVPAFAIHTVGAGGGSIARVDAGGSLRVGPESAGADPGPACYGQGGREATVTDANLVLNRFGGAHLLGGAFRLDERAAEEALTRLADEMRAANTERKMRGRAAKITARDAALGVVRVVNAGMERALRRVSVEQGFDPRFFTLVSFGGAGGLHAVEIARALRIPRVFVPASPGTLSALGALRADVVRDMSRTVMTDASAEAHRTLERVFDEMEDSSRRALTHEGFDDSRQRHERTVAARYKGQSFELELEWKGSHKPARFHALHEATYGYARRENTIEIVSARLRSTGLINKPRRKKSAAESPKQSRTRSATSIAHNLAPHAVAPVYFTAAPTRTNIYHREDLPRDAHLRSPCIITEYSSTTLVPSGARARTDALGNLIIET